MTFSRVNSGGWGFEDLLSSAQMNQLDIDHANAVDKTGDTIPGTMLFEGPVTITNDVITDGLLQNTNFFEANNFLINGGGSFIGGVGFTGGVAFSGPDTNINTALNVNDPSIFNDTVAFNNTIGTASGVQAYFDGPTFLQGATYISGALQVSNGMSVTAGDVTMAGNLNVSGDFILTLGAVFNNDVTVNGAAMGLNGCALALNATSSLTSLYTGNNSFSGNILCANFTASGFVIGSTYVACGPGGFVCGGNLNFAEGGIIEFQGSPTASSATAGSNTLPSNPVGFLIMQLNGSNIKVPYYSN